MDIRKPWRGRRASDLLAMLFLASSSLDVGPALATEPFRPCLAEECGTPRQGAFSHFVIGRVAAVATPAQAAQQFDRMRQAGGWHNLPDDPHAFFAAIQPIVIDAGKRKFLLNTSQAEMHAVPLAEGDLVRYSPHIGDYEKPPEDPIAATYFHVDGCIAVLCRAGDDACAARYATGVFATGTGRQLDALNLTRAPLPGGMAIDTTSMLPKGHR